MDACFYEVKPDYKHSALCKRMWIRECLLIFRDIILFLYVGVTIAMEQNIIIACVYVCVCVCVCVCVSVL